MIIFSILSTSYLFLHLAACLFCRRPSSSASNCERPCQSCKAQLPKGIASIAISPTGPTGENQGAATIRFIRWNKTTRSDKIETFFLIRFLFAVGEWMKFGRWNNVMLGGPKSTCDASVPSLTFIAYSAKGISRFHPFPPMNFKKKRLFVFSGKTLENSSEVKGFWIQHLTQFFMVFATLEAPCHAELICNYWCCVVLWAHPMVPFLNWTYRNWRNRCWSDSNKSRKVSWPNKMLCFSLLGCISVTVPWIISVHISESKTFKYTSSVPNMQQGVEHWSLNHTSSSPWSSNMLAARQAGQCGHCCAAHNRKEKEIKAACKVFHATPRTQRHKMAQHWGSRQQHSPRALSGILMNTIKNSKICEFVNVHVCRHMHLWV